MSVPDPAPGVLRKRQTRYHVQVPSATIRDPRLSLKAKGLLAYLLDKPDGWRFRADAIATESRDGRESVLSGMRELAAAGYTRTTRNRRTDGTWVMWTEVSDAPVAEWATGSQEPGSRVRPGVSQVGKPDPGPAQVRPDPPGLSQVGKPDAGLRSASSTTETYYGSLRDPEAATTPDQEQTLPGMPAVVDPPVPSPRDVVAAYVDGWRTRRDIDPPSGILGQIGREAKRLIAEDYPLPLLRTAAEQAGVGGWRSLENQLGKLPTPTNRHAPPGPDPQGDLW